MMEIDEANIIDDVDEEKALACLLADGQIFLNEANVSWDKSKVVYTVCCYVFASDIFAWGVADGECIVSSDHENPSEIIELYKLWKENKDWGVVKWLCLKRNMQPQYPVKKRMIEENYWDETLENLPLNPDRIHSLKT